MSESIPRATNMSKKSSSLMLLTRTNDPRCLNRIHNTKQSIHDSPWDTKDTYKFENVKSSNMEKKICTNPVYRHERSHWRHTLPSRDDSKLPSFFFSKQNKAIRIPDTYQLAISYTTKSVLRCWYQWILLDYIPSFFAQKYASCVGKINSGKRIFDVDVMCHIRWRVWQCDILHTKNI
jgi:hypothetical protein